METKAKVYKNIACLEICSSYGPKWWYQGGSLAYTPVLIDEIHAVRCGILKGNRKEVLVVGVTLHGKEHLVALNLPRTDIVGLKARGLFPEHLHAPHTTTHYTPWPQETKSSPHNISLA